MSAMTRDAGFLEVSEEVREAIAAGKPVVALESTLIAHGMPFPSNLRTAVEVEELVREAGAVPATIAVIDGRAKVGLSHEDLERIAIARDVYKASRHDLPVLIARGWTGATTVAGTIAVAERAGIPVMATGGIGGVHRDADETMDVSADLFEIARTTVAVVCSGCKSVLDVDWTLEYLETLGVLVLGYQTEEFPGFYSRTSECPVDYRVESAEEIARILQAKRLFGSPGGVVIGNPIPEAFALDPDEVEELVDEALEALAERGIRGKAVTPYLLSYLHDNSGGRTLQANVALVKNNARLAAEVAVWLSSGAKHPQASRA